MQDKSFEYGGHHFIPDFYAASTDKKCDIFRCVENGRLYVPCQYELQQYMDGKQKEIPQGHTSMPRERGQTRERRNAYER